jgi:hypothetical protein
MIPSASGTYEKFGIRNPNTVFLAIINKRGCKMTKKATKYENFFWNFIILSSPIYLSQNLAVSPEKISKVKRIKPAIPIHFPIS